MILQYNLILMYWFSPAIMLPKRLIWELGTIFCYLNFFYHKKSMSKLTWVAACQAFLCGLLGYKTFFNRWHPDQ
ncbi:hypothetical protein ACSBR1_011337 [Camellia fascicularis]